MKTNPKTNTIKGVKGFDKNLQCTPNNNPFQYEIGAEYEEPNAKVCSNGFHFCENPLDVLSYYPLNKGNRYAEVEGSGKIDKKAGNTEDTKVSASKIKIGLEINLEAMIKGAVKFIFERSKVCEKTKATTGNRANAATTGNRANAATTGNSANAATTGEYANAATTGEYANAATTGYSANAATTGNSANAATTGNSANAATTGNSANAATTGYRANAATTGYRANAATTGEYANAATTGNSANAATTGYRANAATTGESIAASLGMEGAAKAAKGSWIVVAEWWQDEKFERHITDVKTAKIDGKRLKADTYYKLVKGKFIEVK